MNDMGNPLAAASLVLAALALVYSAWSVSIQHAIDRQYSGNDTIKRREQEESRNVRNWRAIPLALASTGTLLVFVPRDVTIFCSAWSYWTKPNWAYDDVSAVFMLTQIFVLGLMVHLWAQTDAISQRL